MVSERIIKADLSQERDNFYFKLNQYDNYSRKYRLVIMDNGIPKPFTAQKTIRLVMQAQGEETPYYDGLLSDPWEDGYPVVNFTATMLSKTGVVDFKFIIYEPSSPETISTRIQHLKIQESLVDYDGIIASEEFQFLADILAQAATIPALITDINTTKDEVEALITSVNAQMATYQTEFATLSQNVQDLMAAVTTYMSNVENAAAASAKSSESWAIGGTGTRTGEDTNNSKYYSQQALASADRAEQYAGNVDPKTLSQINGIDTNGLIGSAGATVVSQNLINKISDKTVESDMNFSKLVPYNVDNMDVVFGQEYLSAFHKKIMNRTTNNLLVVFSGDSTTAGNGITNSEYYINNIFKSLCDNKKIEYITVQNNGHSGANTATWASTYVIDDISATTDLLVLRWGLNDANLLLDTSTFETSLRNGLTTLRSARPVESLSVVLMSPNNVDCEAYPEKSPEWGKAINKIIRTAARDFHCCFIDTFGIWRDATNAADWMDNYLVHPQGVMNLWIASRIFNVVIPDAIISKYKTPEDLYNAPNGSSLLSVDSTPSDYKEGIYIYPNDDGGWPFPSGNVINTKTKNDGIIQINWAKTDASQFSIRIGNTSSNTWGNWITLKNIIDPELINAPNGSAVLTSSTPPNLYPDGISIYPIDSSGWPFVDGNAQTTKTKNVGVIQFVWPNDISVATYKFRLGNLTSNTWGPWST